MIPESYENEYSIWLILTLFEVFLVCVTYRRLTLECCHSAGIPSSGALFWFNFRNLRDLQIWNKINIVCRYFRKVMKMNIAFGWFWPLLEFFLFEWRFADWPWNLVILLGFQVPVPYFDLSFGICDTCTCEISWTIISDSSLVFAFFREKHCVLFLVLRIILPEWG